MHYMGDGGARAAPAGRIGGRLRSLAMTAAFDIGGPIAAYSLLRSAGQGTVSALILSGIFPALGITVSIVRNRRLDAIGGLVLAGIAVRALLGLATGSARLVLLEGSVPTVVFGALCLGSLWSGRPMMFRFAHQFIGEGTPQGRDFASRWQYPGFRRPFRVMTVVWGLAYVCEAAARVVIVETTAPSTALAASKAMPYAVTGALAAWTIAYGRRARRRGERVAAAERAAAERAAAAAPPPNAAPLA